MAEEQVLVNKSSLTAIGDAIREQKSEDKYYFEKQPWVNKEITEDMILTRNDGRTHLIIPIHLKNKENGFTITLSDYGEEWYSPERLQEWRINALKELTPGSTPITASNNQYAYHGTMTFTVDADKATKYNYFILSSYYYVHPIPIGSHITLTFEGGEDEYNPETTYTPQQMSQEIKDFMVIPPEAYFLTGDCASKFTPGVNWLLLQVKDKIVIDKDNITNYSNFMKYTGSPLELSFTVEDGGTQSNPVLYEYCFQGSSGLTGTLKVIGRKCSNSFRQMFDNCNNINKIEGEINFSTTSTTGNQQGRLFGLFQSCSKLTDLNDFKIKGNFTEFQRMFSGCSWLTTIPKTLYENITYNYPYASYGCSYMFENCAYLQEAPIDWFNAVIDMASRANMTSVSYMPYYGAFSGCYCLQNLNNIGVFNNTSGVNSNLLGNLVSGNWMLKSFTFKTNEDGTPIIAKWKGAVLDFNSAIGHGYMNYYPSIPNYAEYKRVTNDETYQLYKNEPYWWTDDYNYSRYNHDSAVETINSLPDTSAYGTNTIKFKGQAGALTDGGAINTLTPEEIAVAAAKGWTVTLA